MEKETSANGGSENAELKQAHESVLNNPHSAAALQFAVDQFNKCFSATLNSYAEKSGKKVGKIDFLPVPLMLTIARNQVYRGLLHKAHPKDKYREKTQQSQ